VWGTRVLHRFARSVSARPPRSWSVARVGSTVALLALVPACSDSSPSMLRPRGPSAHTVDLLWWAMLVISAVVFGVVLAMTLVAIARRRRPMTEEERAEPRWGSSFIAIAGVVIPVIVLGSMSVISLRELLDIDSRPSTLRIDVVGHMWWWEARYPNGAVTANEIHVPVGQTVAVHLSTADVIHSFWVPQLAPKLDMVPGMRNTLTLQADAPGRYRGQCAEFCGLQHAHMAFFVVAQPAAAFDAWMAAQAAAASNPDSSVEREGQSVFLTSTCAGCHTIRGTEADATVGPDLTHLASRLTIAAGTLENTRDNLSAFITAPQSLKPGAVMPPTRLSPAQLAALLDYLETLR
jgi:cytochrome c oxidase subunit 2